MGRDDSQEIVKIKSLAGHKKIFTNWMEYISYAFSQTNGRMAKAIILFLSQDRAEEKTRAEILEHLKGKGIATLENGKELDDTQLEKRLLLLARSDVIEMGSTAFRFKGIPDVVFHQVFQLLYSEEIDNIKKEETKAAIRKRNKEEREKTEPTLEAEYLQNKGALLEVEMIHFLKYQAGGKDVPSLEELVLNLPESVSFIPYQTVGDYHFNLPGGYHRQFDVLAKAYQENHPSLLIECKNRKKPIDSGIVEKFSRKIQDIQEQISPIVPIIYSVSGFTKPALTRMKELQIAWSSPILENSILVALGVPFYLLHSVWM